MTRKRVNISVSGELLRRMERESKRRGFKNLCRLTVASVRVVLDTVERCRALEADADGSGAADAGAYIREMFERHSESERDRNGHRKKTGMRHRD